MPFFPFIRADFLKDLPLVQRTEASAPSRDTAQRERPILIEIDVGQSKQVGRASKTLVGELPFWRVEPLRPESIDLILIKQEVRFLNRERWSEFARFRLTLIEVC